MKLLAFISVIIIVGLMITFLGIIFSTKVIDEADELDSND